MPSFSTTLEQAIHSALALANSLMGKVLGEGRPPAKLMMPGFSVIFRISRITEGFIFWARRARVQVVMLLPGGVFKEVD